MLLSTMEEKRVIELAVSLTRGQTCAMQAEGKGKRKKVHMKDKEM